MLFGKKVNNNNNMRNFFFFFLNKTIVFFSWRISYLHMASTKKIYRYSEILAEKTTTFTGPSISSTSDFFLSFSTSNKNWLMVRWGAAHCIKWCIGMLYILLLFLHISIKRHFYFFFVVVVSWLVTCRRVWHTQNTIAHK